VTSVATVYAIAGTDTVQTTSANATGFQVSVSASIVLGNAQNLTGVNLVPLP
jgi:hypothetical protein